MKHIGRKLFHILGGVGLLSLYYLLGRRNALVCYVLIALSILALDVIRLRITGFNTFLQKHFSSFIRMNESNKLTGIFPYMAGVGLTLFLYRTDIATVAILFLIFGDVTATTVGERFGRTRLAGQKSLEGTLAFIAAAVLAGLLMNMTMIRLPFGLILFGAVIAACVELLPFSLNDNITIPVISGGVMEAWVRINGWI